MAKQVVDWEQIADWFDEKQGDEGDLWHRTLINPTLLSVVGKVAGAQVLDLACGNGALSRTLARSGAHVVGADMAPTFVARARQREAQAPLGIAYHVADAADLSAFADASFELVVCNMGIQDMPDATVQAAFQEVSRLLEPSGRFVASLEHPCFEGIETAAWVVEKLGRTTTVWRKVSRYRELYEIRPHWRISPEHFLYTTSYHRPLAWYFRAFRAAGLAVTALEENEPTDEFIREDNEGAWIQQIPLHCVFEATKLG